MGKDLLDLLPKDDENLTPEDKEAIAFVKHEVMMCETMVVLITTGS